MGKQDKENKEVAVLTDAELLAATAPLLVPSSFRDKVIEEAKGWFCENREDSDFPCTGALGIQGVGEDSDGFEVALMLCQAHREEWAVLNG